MKRKPLILSAALLFVVSAALWGANYRLNHPPLTKSDKEFRALVAGADSVEGSQFNCQKQSACAGAADVTYKPLNTTQTHELLEQIRLLDGDAQSQMKRQGIIYLNLTFSRKGKILYNVILNQSLKASELQWSGAEKTVISPVPFYFYKINPRFNKRLNRALDAYLPQRIRP